MIDGEPKTMFLGKEMPAVRSKTVVFLQRISTHDVAVAFVAKRLPKI